MGSALIDGVLVEWDDFKGASNLKKHGVRFEQAATIVKDNHALVIFDPDHSDEEDRYVTIGSDSVGNILTIIVTYRNKTLRLISARKANREEAAHYVQSRTQQE